MSGSGEVTAMATEYVCEVTGKKYKTKRGAENSAKRERLLDWQRNYFRLNATSVEHLVELMVEKGREFWGWNLKVNDLKHYGTNTSSQGKVSIKFALSFKFRPEERHNKHTLIVEYLIYHVLGLEAMSNWTSFHSHKVMDNYCTLIFYFYPDKFPLINSKYVEYCDSVIEFNKWENEKSVVDLEALRFLRLQEDFKMVENHIRTLEQKLDIARNTKYEIEKYYKNGYKELWVSRVPEPQIDEEIDKMFRKRV